MLLVFFYKMLLTLVADDADHYLYDYYYMALVLAIIRFYAGVRGVDFVMRFVKNTQIFSFLTWY